MPVIPQAILFLAKGRSSDFVLAGGVVFPNLSTFQPQVGFKVESSDTVNRLIKMDLQHRVMSQNLTAFPS